MEKEKLIKKFNKQANKYDKQRAQQSKSPYRRRIFQSIKGRTLEVAVGAGMNFAFIPPTSQYVGVDFSPEMLKKAETAAKKYSFQSTFILSEVEELRFADGEFDTIISSGTLCSYENPIEVLNRFNQWTASDGQVLLLEHGLFKNRYLAWLQKKLNPIFYKTIGCHQNRNILEIVQQSDLEVVKCERKMNGYLYMIWAKPKKNNVPS